METSFHLDGAQSRFGKPYNVLGMDDYLKIAGSDTNGQMSLFYSEYTEDQGPPLHLHPVDETFYITEGEFIFQLGDNRVRAVAGGTIFIPRMMPHAFLTTSVKGCMLFMVNPAGNVEMLFERLSSYAQMPSIEEVVRVHEELGLKIVGPPLAKE